MAYKNIAFLLLGYLLLALGIVGIVLPVMPTTIFFILALGCFTRSSPKLANWLLNHPRYGATLQQWQQHQVVPIKAKWFAALGMFAGFVILNYSAAPYWVACMVAATEIIVLAYLLSRPSRPQQLFNKQHIYINIVSACLFACALFATMIIANQPY